MSGRGPSCTRSCPRTSAATPCAATTSSSIRSRACSTSLESSSPPSGSRTCAAADSSITREAERGRRNTLIQLEISDKPRTEKPWGYELRWAITDKYLGKVLHIKRGEALSLQYHSRKDESILLLNGLMDLDLEDDEGVVRIQRLVPGDSRRIHPGRRHRMTAVEECDVCEVSTPDLDDVVRLEDRYGRR